MGRLPRFAVQLLVIFDVEPGDEHPIEFVQGEDLAGTDFRFQLHLQGLEEAFDQASGRCISGRSMEQLDF